MTPDWTASEARLTGELQRLAQRASASEDAFEQIEGRLLVDLEPERPPRRPRSSRPIDRRQRHAVALLGLAAGIALVVGALVGISGGGSTGGSRQVSVAPAGPSHAATLSGEVAYVSGGRLTLVTSGPAAQIITMDATGAANPKWSADGRWIAYQSGPTAAPDELHIAAADGTGDRVAFHGAVFAFAWSGLGALLAASPVDAARAGGGLVLLSPSEPTRVVVPPGPNVFSFHWSTHSSTLAYSLVGQAGQPDEVRVFDTATGLVAKTAFAATPGEGLVIGKWWPNDQGLLWWVDPDHSASLEADGLALQSVPLDTLQPQDLLRTPVFLNWLAWSPDGSTLAVVTGGDRFPWDGQGLAFCHPEAAGPCSLVPQPAGIVTLDPAWSPDGTRLAFVRAPTQAWIGNGVTFTTWYPTRTLWTSAADGVTGVVEQTGAAPGVSSVSWSTDGATLRYATARTIEVIGADGGSSTVLASGLSGGSGAGPDGYGKTPWGGLPMWQP